MQEMNIKKKIYSLYSSTDTGRPL